MNISTNKCIKNSRTLSPGSLRPHTLHRINTSLTFFAKTLHSRCLTGFWIYQSSKYATVLSISRLRICFLFCMYQSSKYVRVTEASEDAYALRIFKYVWICQNMREYTFICLIGFCFKFLHCNLFRLFSWGDIIWFLLK